MEQDPAFIESCAEALDEASLRAEAIAPPLQQQGIDIAQAYRIQQALLARRIARGERMVGLKMGFTSMAKMAQMGVSDQICGRLTDAMQAHDGAAISLQGYIHPRCEPELAFLLGAALPPDAGETQLLQAIAAVAPAIEIIDSRYRQFKFSLTDVIADNASSAGFVLGEWQPCRGQVPAVDDMAVILSINGEERQRGSTTDILGNPLRSLAAAARLAHQTGAALKAGDIVLAGAATSAEALAPGMRVEANVAGLGAVAFTVR